jgi:AraC-like DNA-binding protein
MELHEASSTQAYEIQTLFFRDNIVTMLPGFCELIRLSDVPTHRLSLPDSLYRLWIVEDYNELNAFEGSADALKESLYFCPPSHAPKVDYCRLRGWVCWFDFEFVAHQSSLDALHRLLKTWSSPVPTVRNEPNYVYQVCRAVCRAHTVLQETMGDSSRKQMIADLHKSLILAHWGEVLITTVPWLMPVQPTSIVNQFIGLVEVHYTEEWKPARYAQVLHVSESTLLKSCKRDLNLSPSEVIRARRLRAAQQRLTQSDQSIGDIASDLGYGSHTYFSEQFKQYAHMSPQAYRSLHSTLRS